MADHRQNFAGARIESHHRARTVAHRSFRRHLQVQVDGQAHVVSGIRASDGRQHPYFLPTAIHHHPPHAIATGENLVVLALHAELSHHITGPIG